MGKAADLSREQIVTTALALLDEHGLPGLSMRRIAETLGVRAASLYYHVDSQDDLVDAIHDLIDAQIDVGLLEEPTHAALVAFARSYRDVYQRHPHAIAMVARRPLRAPKALTVYDALAKHLLARGLAEADVMPVLAMLDFMVLGSAGETLASDFPLDPAAYADRHPHLARVLIATDQARTDRQSFELAMDACLGAIDSLIPSPLAG